MQRMNGFITKLLLLFMPLALLVVCSGLAQAKPTISGILQNYNPGGGRLQIVRADGVVKTVVMRPNAIYALNGVVGSPHYFRNGMNVAVRICGSINDDPLQGDLLIDAFSSGKVVQRRANTYNNTTVGTFASVSGANGIASMASPVAPAPSVVGPVGLGGNFTGSLTNPGVAGPVTNSAFPSMNQPGQGSLAVSTISNTSETTSQNSTLMDNDEAAAKKAEEAYAHQGFMSGPAGSSTGLNSMISGSDVSNNGQPNGMLVTAQSSSGPLGMQIAQIQGGIISIDPRNLVIAVVPQGSTQPVQVKVPAGTPITNSRDGQPVTFGELITGQQVMIAGVANAAGFVEARQLTVAK